MRPGCTHCFVLQELSFLFRAKKKPSLPFGILTIEKPPQFLSHLLVFDLLLVLEVLIVLTGYHACELVEGNVCGQRDLRIVDIMQDKRRVACAFALIHVVINFGSHPFGSGRNHWRFPGSFGILNDSQMVPKFFSAVIVLRLECCKILWKRRQQRNYFRICSVFIQIWVIVAFYHLSQRIQIFLFF